MNKQNYNADTHQRDETLESSLSTPPHPIVSPALWSQWLRVQLGMGKTTDFFHVSAHVLSVLSGMQRLPLPAHPGLACFYPEWPRGNTRTDTMSFTNGLTH